MDSKHTYSLCMMYCVQGKTEVRAIEPRVRMYHKMCDRFNIDEICRYLRLIPSNNIEKRVFLTRREIEYTQSITVTAYHLCYCTSKP
jgi:hypothetical protein